jgi:hypothetical protein
MLQPPDTPERKSRETVVSLMLSTVALGFFLLVLIIITGGLVIYLLAVVAALAAFAGLHYFLWGRALHEATAGEREEEELREKADADGWPAPGPPRGRR